MIDAQNIVKLRDLCDDYKKDIVDGPFGANLKREHYIEEGVPVLKIQNIKQFEIVLKEMDYVTDEKAKELNRHSYRSGDIIITKLGLPLGVSAIVSDIENGIIVADLVRVRAQKIDTKYLCYHLNSPKTNSFLNEQSKGTTRPRVRISSVRDLPIYAPPLPEQKRIVAILDEAFASIASAVEATEKNLENAVELFQSKLNSIFSNSGDAVNEWRSATLGTVCEVIKRGVAPKYIDDGGVLVFNQKCVRNHTVDSSLARRHNAAAKRVPEDRFVQIGDVLVNSTGVGTLGRVAQIRDTPDEPATVDTHVTIVRPKQSMFYREFFGYMMVHIESEIAESGEGASGQTELSRTSLSENFKVQFPVSLTEQQRIVALLDDLRVQTSELEVIYQQKLDDLHELKQSVLQKAFSGELTSESAKSLAEAGL